MTAIARVIRSVVLATATATMLAAWEPATAQEATPLPVYTGARLYVKDVPDHYESVARTIKDLERQSPQSYFVVVVKSSGAGQHATRDYLDRLYDSWRRDAKAKNLKLDPERSVVVVAALDNRQVAVHPGSLLRDRFGLKGTTIDGEIVQRAFIPLARENDYPGALSALLTSTNNFLAAHGDSETKAVASQGGASRRSRRRRKSQRPRARRRSRSRRCPGRRIAMRRRRRRSRRSLPRRRRRPAVIWRGR